MKKFAERIILIAALGISQNTLAKPEPALTYTCKEGVVKTQGLNYALNAGKSGPQVYMLKNTSRQTLLLNHPVKNPSASAGWGSFISPNHWSAIRVDQNNFVLSCAIAEKKTYHPTACNPIRVCQLNEPLAKPKKLEGAFWLIENKLWRAFYLELAQKVQRKG